MNSEVVSSEQIKYLNNTELCAFYEIYPYSVLTI